MNAEEVILNFDKPVLQRDKMEYYPDGDGPRGRYHPCEVCDKGIIPGFRSTEPPFNVMHDQNCVGCGQRYYFENLGIFEPLGDE